MEISRKRLNLMVVLDHSSSMNEEARPPDFGGGAESGAGKRPPEEGKKATRIEVAAEAVITLLDHLKPQDRFGLVMFDYRAFPVINSQEVGGLNLEALRFHLRNLRPRHPTSIGQGLGFGVRLLSLLEMENPTTDEEYRVVLLTNDLPIAFHKANRDDLILEASRASPLGIHSTVIGIGEVFPIEIAEILSRIPGASHLAISTTQDARRLLASQADLVGDRILTREVELFDNILRESSAPDR